MSEKTYTINDLRGDIAATIKSLRNGDESMTVEKAKEIGNLAQAMINSAKVEVEALRAMGNVRARPTGFLALEPPDTLDLQDRKQPAQLEARKSARPHVRNPMGSAPRGSL